MARPSKYKPESSLTSEPVSFAHAKKLRLPLVYGICDMRDGVIVYVGQSINPGARINCYLSPKSCHNAALRNWLFEEGRQAGIVVLHTGSKSLDEAEKYWIAELKPQVFNLVHGGVQAWRKHTNQPWMAGVGLSCPSSLVLQHLQRNSSIPLSAEKLKSFHDMRNSMTIVNRCAFEIALCRDVLLANPRFTARVERWLDITRTKLLVALEQ